MASVSTTNNIADLVKYEAGAQYSRDLGIIAAAQNLTVGTVLSTKGGKFYVLAPGASDGTELAVAVLGSDCDATLADTGNATIIARHATVSRNALVWPAGITAPQKVTAEAQLKALGILVRDSA